MLSLVTANLARRRARSAATALGIAVGVATIVALLALTSGLQQSASGLVHLGRADFGVFQGAAADPSASVLPSTIVDRLKRRPEVAEATPLVLAVEQVKQEPGAVVFGADPNGFVVRRLVVTAGRPAAGRREVLVGDLLAKSLHARPGSSVTIGQRRFAVAGVYHAGIFAQDLGAIVSLADGQALAGRAPTEVTTVAVRLAPTVSQAAARRSLAMALPGVLIISDPGDALRAGANGRLISKAVLLIVVLALVVGGLGVANTMVMAVLERERELAVLGAVGWSGRQLAALVLGEAVAISLLGAALGLLLGVIGSDLLARTLGLTQFVSPNVTAWGLGRGLLVGIAIGVLGGLYPTLRVSRLDPAPLLARG